MTDENKQEYTIGLSAKGFQVIESTRERLGLPHNEDVINLALSLLSWSISKSSVGEMIGSINKTSNFTKLNVEDLDKIRMDYENKENKS